MIRQEVEQISVERNLIIKQENIARRTYKIHNWLKLISMHRENQNYQAIENIIRNQMHQHFILHQDFWLQHVSAELQIQNATQKDIDFAMLALDDGPYFIIASLIADKITSLFLAQQLRMNYCLSILEKCITIFSFDKRVNKFFKCLRRIYKQKNQVERIRAAFERQIKLAHDDFDVVWEEYRAWQPSPNIFDGNKSMYADAKVKWERRKVDMEQYHCSQQNVRQSLFNLEGIKEDDLDEKNYLAAVEKLPTEVEKLWFLRRMALQRHIMFKQYLLKLELIHKNDEELMIKKYKSAIRLANNPLIEMRYLCFLARRINRHLLNEPLPEDYQDTWGANVAFFREELCESLHKVRAGTTVGEKREISQNFTILWLQVQCRIIKDMDSICQLYQSLLKDEDGYPKYKEYSDILLEKGAVNEAKNVLKRYVHKYPGEQSRITYKNFIYIYGTIQEQVQFEKNNGNIFNHQNQSNEYRAIVENLVEESSQTPKVVHPVAQIQPEVSYKREREEVKDETGQKILQSTRKKVHVDSESTIFVKDVPLTWTELDVLKIIHCKDKVKEIRFPQKNNKPKSYCYIEFQSVQAAEEEIKKQHNGLQFYFSKPPAQYDESNTLFLCALPKTTTEEKIRKFFGEHGKNIVDIRLKISEQKNYAYVQFKNVDERQEAHQYMKNMRMVIDGKRVLLQICDSSRSKNKKFIPVVYLKNLAFKAKESDIRQFFAGKTLSKLLIPQTTDPKPRGMGFAYVQFQKFGDFQEALDMKKGTILGRQFQILRSDRQITQSTKYHERDEKREKKTRSTQKQRKSQEKQSQKKDNNYFSGLFK